MSATQIIFLGSDSVTPTAGEDTVSFLINRTLLVDTGWASALRMMDHGLTPLDLDYLVFTHLHHDHYVGLPQILFYRWMKQRGQTGARPLTIIGPADDLELVVNLAIELLQPKRFHYQPLLHLVPLAPGETYETERFKLTTCETIHPVQGLCYRYKDRANGAVTVFTGDTAFCPPIAELAGGADLLIHEASHGAAAQRESTNQYGHSGSPDAATIAQMAKARRLALVHGPVSCRDAALAAAREIFPNTFWPAAGEQVEVEPDA
ncbi:MAG: MBL fold metallo-hydrolase [Armatimonadetes bacterium]|nr:MBL fold metallo-hydrolase [Armatimonadota bacterium]